MSFPRLSNTVQRLSFSAAIALGLLVTTSQASAQISLTPGPPYTQNFDTLASAGTSSTLPTGWVFLETGANANTLYTAGTGSLNTGDTYSFGAAASAERALGGLLSGSLTPTFGASFINNTGVTITSLLIGYNGEEWRLGTAGRADRLDFQYSTDATSLTTGTWTDVNPLDFNTPVTVTVGAKDGNLAANRTAISAAIPALTIPNGATFWIRWSDFNASGADDGLAVDDFSLTVNPPPVLSINDVAVCEGNAGTTTFAFTVSLSAPAPVGGVTFDIATADGTATTVGNDYVANSATGVTITQGNTTSTFNVTVNGDVTVEPNEAFSVNLTNVTGTGVIVADATGVGSIVNDDGLVLPNLTINDVTLVEGNGSTSFVFTVSLSAPAGACGVSFTVDTANGTATAPADYAAITSSVRTIPSGSSSTTVNVTVNGDLLVEPTETFTVNITGATFAVITDGQGLGTITDDDVAPISINQIQGSGITSPIVSTVVTTTGIVTARKSNGFFIQTPDPGDGNPLTSDGLFVFTSSAPAVAVGDSVFARGTVLEFIPGADPNQQPVTELGTFAVFSIVSSGNPLPAPVTITAADTLVNDVNNLERFEGMRVFVPSLTATAPTDGFTNESAATSTSDGVFYAVVTGVPRPFREEGIDVSDPLPAGAPPTVPRWDANPERIRVDSDSQTGATALDVTSGAVVTNVTGVVDYSFRTYTILPDPSPVPTVTGNITFTPVPVPFASEYTVAAFNLERFYDDINDPGGDVQLTPTAFQNRLNKASLAIRNVLRLPDILGVIEMEDLKTLQQLATRVNNDAVAAGQGTPNYVAYLSEGNDVGLIDVGFLVKSSRVTVIDVTQFGLTDTYINPNDGLPDILNDRPPLVLRANVNQPGQIPAPITVIVNHLRSLNNVDDPTPDGTGTVGARVRFKRRAQAEYLANLIQARQVANPGERIISIGDYNAFEVNDGYGDSMGTIRGQPTPAALVTLASPDLVDPDLVDLLTFLPAADRYSFCFGGTAQTLDHEVVTQNLLTDFRRVAYGRVNGDFPEIYRTDPTRPERISDHDAEVAYFSFPGCPSLSIFPTNLLPMTVGVTVNTTLSVSGGTAPYTFAVTAGTLPPGLFLNVFTGQLFGTPTTAGIYNFQVSATDSTSCSTTAPYRVTVSCPAIAVSPASLTGGEAGVAYSQTLTASGGTSPYTFALASGALPTGLSLSSSGVIAGTPSAGTFTFVARATDARGCTGTATYTLTFTSPEAAVTTTTLSSLPNPSVFGQSVVFTATVSAASGTPTGSVSFVEGPNTLGTATLSGGAATFTTATLPIGSHSITAVFAGTAPFAGSTSSPLVQNVKSPGGCNTPGDGNLCVQANRFTISIAWKNPYDGGTTGVGTAVALTDETGYFWFFNAANVELMLKVLDGRSINGKYWVLFGALSDVEYTITITDNTTGAVKTYYNPPGHLGSFIDMNAFAGRPEGPTVKTAEPISLRSLAGGPAVVTGDGWSGRLPAESRVPAAPSAACTTGGDTLCVNGGRFQVKVAWKNYNDGSQGNGTAAQITGDTGTFWFFNPANLELVVKVLDGRTTNGKFWVIYGALTDVEYTVTVTDTDTGAVKTYHNAPHNLGSLIDTLAF